MKIVYPKQIVWLLCESEFLLCNYYGYINTCLIVFLWWSNNWCKASGGIMLSFFFLLACCIASSYSGSYTIFLQFICGDFLSFLVHKPYALSHMIHSLSFPKLFLFACQVLSLIFPWCGTFCRKVPRTTSFPNYNSLKLFTQKFNKCLRK